MAVVKGIREKVHLPLYDAVTFPEQKKISDNFKNGNVLRFFVDVQNKTKLETNQQEASVLSHYNTYEARALRVVLQPPTKKKREGDTYIEEVFEDWDNLPVTDTRFITDFIYNSVTTFVVGEKRMIQAPTWFFPGGAGPANQEGKTNGDATPEATFRFAEPVHISHQQNFRVEIEFPQGVEKLMNGAVGPAKVWVVIDGYITRDVQ